MNDGTLLGAAIDTYENEAAYFTNDWTNKDIDDKTLLELIEHERILVTPHIAFFSDEAVQNLVEGGLNAALSVINTGTCETRLNYIYLKAKARHVPLLFILYICIKIDLIKIRFILSSIQMILVRLFYYGIIA